MSTIALASKPVRPVQSKVEGIQPGTNGYVKGAQPSQEASTLEHKVEKALYTLGATPAPFLNWSIQELILFIQNVEYYKSPPGGSKWPTVGHMLLQTTLKFMGNSHPHIKAWEQLSTREAIDFLLGVDIAVQINGELYCFDITANPEAVESKKEKAKYAFKGARFDILKALGCKHYIVVLAQFDKDIGLKLLEDKLSSIGEKFTTSISLVKPKRVINVIPSGLLPEGEVA